MALNSTFIFTWRYLAIATSSTGALSFLAFHTSGLEVSFFYIYASGSYSWLQTSPNRPRPFQTDTLKQSVYSLLRPWLLLIPQSPLVVFHHFELIIFMYIFFLYNIHFSKLLVLIFLIKKVIHIHCRKFQKKRIEKSDNFLQFQLLENTTANLLVYFLSSFFLYV